MGPENRRILIVTVASVAIFFAWSIVQEKLYPKPPQAPRTVAASTAAPVPGVGTAAPSPAPAVAPVPEAPEELVTLEDELFKVVLSTHGGGLAHLELKNKKFMHRVNEKDVAIDLVHVAKGHPLPLSLAASAELGGGSDPLLDPTARSAMRVISKDARQVVFEGRVGAASVRKTFRLSGKPYEVVLDVEVSGVPANGLVSLLYTGFMPPSTSSGGFLSGPSLEFVRPVCRAGDKTERFDVVGDDVTKQHPVRPAGPASSSTTSSRPCSRIPRPTRAASS